MCLEMITACWEKITSLRSGNQVVTRRRRASRPSLLRKESFLTRKWFERTLSSLDLPGERKHMPLEKSLVQRHAALERKLEQNQVTLERKLEVTHTVLEKKLEKVQESLDRAINRFQRAKKKDSSSHVGSAGR